VIGWIEGIQNAIEYIEDNHGISPSSAKLKGANLKSFAPVKIKLILEGGTMLEYSILSGFALYS